MDISGNYKKDGVHALFPFINIGKLLVCRHSQAEVMILLDA